MPFLHFGRPRRRAPFEPGYWKGSKGPKKRGHGSPGFLAKCPAGDRSPVLRSAPNRGTLFKVAEYTDFPPRCKGGVGEGARPGWTGQGMPPLVNLRRHPAAPPAGSTRLPARRKGGGCGQPREQIAGRHLLLLREFWGQAQKKLLFCQDRRFFELSACVLNCRDATP